MKLAYTIAGAAFGLCLAALPALADVLPVPTGEVVLTISGAISNTNVDDTAQFDMDMLKAMDVETFETSTMWTEGVQTFTGVSLHALLEAVGADDVTIHATAINDYAVDIPPGDWKNEGPILAYERNGALMTIRNKGPLWIVYPFDSDARFRAEVIYSRSIWQLDRIIVGD
ncbi:MAG: oxidoreductase [Rhodobacteraceae bacterium]|nr:oxidoreductase [Paracoccaceae bacterium]MAY48130.1 oxidoreductase [Paracoccaceae bacterium]QEW21969.1 Oxidoreductase molybdopterin binding domain protein [Marinibacterium anthonyi]